MPVSGRSVVRRTGRILTGVGALIVLCALLAGAPVALIAFAGNPLPDHLPTITEVGTALTSRDDGQLFLRALAVAGWFGWATFAFSVLVELGAQSLRRPAPKLPGMGRQQKAAAALVGSVALILAASPAAASAAAVYAAPTYAPAVTTQAGPASTSTMGTAHAVAAPRVAGPLGLVAPAGPAASDEAAPVYRVARGDYLGEVAERYLDEFADYRRLAELNRLDDPDRIHPGQLLRLPAEAADQGARPHATGRLAGRPAAPKPPPPRSAPERTAPERVAPAPPSGTESAGQPPAMTVGAARAGTSDRVNRPLAVSAVLAVASIVGAQIGAVLGLRRRPATAGAAPRLAASTRTPRGGAGRSIDSTSRTTGDRTPTGGTPTRQLGDGPAGSGATWPPVRTAPAIEATAPTAGGTAPAGAPAWGADEGWGGDEGSGGDEGWGSDEGWGTDAGDGLLAGGPGLDSVPDGPSVGRHRRS
ncbi:LysM peptidoglycan-binding domain-containing protein [Micromonospora sp. NBC_00858]|uniref:LysM peptidoglycan-binding domain-containing protein n=1 Tax=Micromonospora sp. NBC_00858 TaxID=2975979 RepID=UPI0038633312